MSDFGTLERQRRGKMRETTADVTAGGMEASKAMQDDWSTYPRFLRFLGVLGRSPECDYRVNAADSFVMWKNQSHSRATGSDEDGGKAYMLWLSLCDRLGHVRLKVMNELTDIRAEDSIPAAPVTLDDALRTLRGAVKIGNTELIAFMTSELERLSELRKMQEAIIRVHRLSARIRERAYCDALDAAMEAMQSLRVRDTTPVPPVPVMSKERKLPSLET